MKILVATAIIISSLATGEQAEPVGLSDAYSIGRNVYIGIKCGNGSVDQFEGLQFVLDNADGNKDAIANAYTDGALFGMKQKISTSRCELANAMVNSIEGLTK